MKNKIYVTNSFDIMKVDGIYDIRSISDKEIAELSKDYEFVNRGNGWLYVNTENGEVVYVVTEGRPVSEPLDLSDEVFCKILLIQESGNKIIEYATVTGETPACIYFP